MGNVPPSPRRSNAGRSAPRHMSSIPPVPNVALASPGRTHPCPISDACWSPAIPAIGGAPGSAVALPTMPVESTMAGSTLVGTRSTSSTWSSHPLPSPRTRPVTPTLDWSVTWSWPFESTHAIHVSTVPNRRSSRVRSGSAMSSRNASFVADWFGANRVPSAASTRHMPAVRRSCHPTPGPTGSPVFASQTIVDARWFAMPTASTGPPAASAALAASRAASAISRRVELDERGSRRRRQHLAVVHVVDARVGTNDRRAHSARSDVDDEDAHDAGSPLTRRAPPRVASGLR